ncbi:hypothetical protein EON81_09445 [bacterium]|nr:MAG: hypothetical protein EON81_09445 [bacterium]
MVMKQARALSFAKASLRLFFRESDFDIELYDEDDFHVVSQAFVTLGCIVGRPKPFRWILNVSLGSTYPMGERSVRRSIFPDRVAGGRYSIPGIGHVRISQMMAIQINDAAPGDSFLLKEQANRRGKNWHEILCQI